MHRFPQSRVLALVALAIAIFLCNGMTAPAQAGAWSTTDLRTGAPLPSGSVTVNHVTVAWQVGNYWSDGLRILRPSLHANFAARSLSGGDPQPWANVRARWAALCVSRHRSLWLDRLHQHGGRGMAHRDHDLSRRNHRRFDRQRLSSALCEFLGAIGWRARTLPRRGRRRTESAFRRDGAAGRQCVPRADVGPFARLLHHRKGRRARRACADRRLPRRSDRFHDLEPQQSYSRPDHRGAGRAFVRLVGEQSRPRSPM